MSFRQIFDRISQLARSSVMNDYHLGGTYQEALRRAEELIQEARMRDEKKDTDQRKQTNSQFEKDSYHDWSGKESDGTLTYEEACQIIGVPVHATRTEISAAYRRKIIKYHPDRTSNLSQERQQHAMEQTRLLNQAYTFLKKHAVG